MLSKILFGIEVVALIAAPVGYLKLRDYRAEQFFDKGNAALQAGDWGQAYAYYQEAARRDNDAVKASVACRLTLCKDFGLGVAPAAQIENCPLHGDAFSDCLAASKVPTTKVLEAAKQGLFESGSTDVIVWIASTYRKGSFSVPQDYAEAVAWYRVAAARGHLDAQRYLISMAYFQQWTPAPGELPSDWLLNTKDMLIARILLGERIAAGDEALAQDPESINWLLDAANDGNAAAQACIGINLAEGEHFLIPQETATNYVLAAARQGNEKAQAQIVELAQRNIYRDARWDTLPTEWLLAAAKQGNEKAQIRIVELIQAGLYMEANWGDLPIAWLIAAAQNNNEAAQAHLGAKLAEGAPLDLPEETAISYLFLAAKQGNKKAQAQIIEPVLAGKCSAEMEKEILPYILAAAKSGNERVYAYLGNKLVAGEFLDLSEETAIICLLAVAKTGNEQAQLALGAKLAEGTILPIPEEVAFDYLLLAAKQDNEKAKAQIIEKVLAGKCSTKTEKEVLPIFLSAAKNGNKRAHVYLGTKLAKGETFDLPEETVVVCLNAVARQGNEKAQIRVVELTQSGDHPNLNWDSLPTEWIVVAGKNGNEKAQARIVELAQRGVYQDARWDSLPTEWLIAAAKNNNEGAQAYFGAKLAAGEDLFISEETATDYLFVAAKQGNGKAQSVLLTDAKQGNKKAQSCLVELVMEGRCSAEMEKEAHPYLLAAVQQGNEDVRNVLLAISLLALSKQDNLVARNALIDLAKQGNEEVQVYIGAKLAAGESIDVPEEIATICLSASAKHGNDQAKKFWSSRSKKTHGRRERTKRRFVP